MTLPNPPPDPLCTGFFCSPFLQSKWLQYDHDPRGLLVVLVILHCVSTTETKMDTAHSVEEDGHEFDAGVGCKAEGQSTAVTL